MTNRLLKRAIIAGFAALLSAPVASAFGIGLQPTTVEVEFEPGDRRRQVVNIANVHTEKTISLTLGLADWALDENGQIKLSPPGETDTSAAEWVRFSPAFITLRPGESEQIVVDMSAPVRLNRSGDFRFALLASTILPEQRDAGSGVWKKYQIASLFYLTTPDAESAPEIVSSAVSLDEAGTPYVGLRVENDGNAHARLEGQIEVRPQDGETEIVPIGNLVVLDGAARNFRAPLEVSDIEGADIRVRLTNTFAPQVSGGITELPVHKVAGVAPVPDGAGGEPESEPLN